jgi:hypothetical protein
MKEFFYFILTLIIVIGSYNEYKDQKKYGEVEQNYLKEITIKDSTYVIVDYNYFKRSYVLHNGTTISKSAVKSLLGDDYGK